MTAIISDSRINLIVGDITEQITDDSQKMWFAILEECKIIRKTEWPQGLPAGEAVSTSGGR